MKRALKRPIDRRNQSSPSILNFRAMRRRDTEKSNPPKLNPGFACGPGAFWGNPRNLLREPSVHAKKHCLNVLARVLIVAQEPRPPPGAEKTVLNGRNFLAGNPFVRCMVLRRAGPLGRVAGNGLASTSNSLSIAGFGPLSETWPHSIESPFETTSKKGDFPR